MAIIKAIPIERTKNMTYVFNSAFLKTWIHNHVHTFKLIFIIGSDRRHPYSSGQPKKIKAYKHMSTRARVVVGRDECYRESYGIQNLL